MRYLPFVAAAVFGVITVCLLGLPVGSGVLLALAAGAAAVEELPDRWSWSPDEIVTGILTTPPTVLLATTGRTVAAITVSALAGGLAVPVFAGMHTVAALNTGAARIAGPDPEEDM